MDAASLHIAPTGGLSMANDKGQEGGSELCSVCKRDPDSPPPVPPPPEPPTNWRGTKAKWAVHFRRTWPEIWAKRVKVVAHGMCAKDYQATRRPKSKRSNSRKGATERLTIWVTPETKTAAETKAESQEKSVSTWGSDVIERDLGLLTANEDTAAAS